MTTWKPDNKVFAGRSASDARGRTTDADATYEDELADIVKKAASDQAGTPYSPIPAVNDGKALVVLFALPDGKTSVVNVDLR
jgi:hypothetical protein